MEGFFLHLAPYFYQMESTLPPYALQLCPEHNLEEPVDIPAFSDQV